MKTLCLEREGEQDATDVPPSPFLCPNTPGFYGLLGGGGTANASEKVQEDVYFLFKSSPLTLTLKTLKLTDSNNVYYTRDS